ncbi:nuclease-related domain-containing protein [Spirillospora sp. CA-294931]|uniref:nuclease-related domain-containing protein n=1 Tax=Spirillospora sp. CA-294931 TaxID=3240042 RepID=UPI003D8E6DA2
MFGSSIYLRDRVAFTGGTPQAVYEELWQRGRKGRLRTRAIFVVLTIVLCGAAVNAVFGIAMGLVVAALDTYFHWRGYHASSVWRRGLRGDERMARILRRTMERRGHRVLHSRTIPGHGEVDQLMIGPGGVWLIHNEAWHPEAEISEYGGKLFIDGRTQSRLVSSLTGAAVTATQLLTERAEVPVKVIPVLAVHGGKLMTSAPFTADGIAFARPYKLLRWISRNPKIQLTPEEVETVTRAAVHALPIGGRTMEAA